LARSLGSGGQAGRGVLRGSSHRQRAMAPSLIALSLYLGSAAGMTLVNRKSGKCLDLSAPCADGTAREGCQNPPKDMTKGINLQLLRCTGKENQEFEFTKSGRIRNSLTGVCLDIAAPCKDHLRSPCERVPVTQLKAQAKIHLFACHKDTGVLSNSYGNQKWRFQLGVLQNVESDLCLAPKQEPKGPEGQKPEEMANVWADTCVRDESQKFDWLGSSTQLLVTKLSVPTDAASWVAYRTRPQACASIMIACVCGSFIVALVRRYLVGRGEQSYEQGLVHEQD